MEFKVEKGVKLPTYKGNKKYPELNVGESFFVQCKEAEEKQVRNALSSTFNRRDGKYTVRQVEGGLRVWRVD